MPVLKKQSNATVFGGAVAMDLTDLRAEATRVVAEARQEADRILREARAEATRLRAAAVEEGRAEGIAKGTAEGLGSGRLEGEAAARTEVSAAFTERFNGLVQTWTTAIERWNAERDELMREARGDVIGLALSIASRVVRRALDIDPKAVVAQLDAALVALGHATSITIACSTEDRALLESALPALAEQFAAAKEATFVVDPELKRGDVVVRASDGAVDATIATQLDRIAEAVLPSDGGEGTRRGAHA